MLALLVRLGAFHVVDTHQHQHVDMSQHSHTSKQTIPVFETCKPACLSCRNSASPRPHRDPHRWLGCLVSQIHRTWTARRSLQTRTPLIKTLKSAMGCIAVGTKTCTSKHSHGRRTAPRRYIWTCMTMPLWRHCKLQSARQAVSATATILG